MDPGLPAQVYAAMAFRYPWRIYQRMILERFEARDPAKRTFHVVAPPGSGKTMIGIEIARRMGRPSVTFSPTTTIQEQWRDKVRFFRPEGDTAGEDALLGHVSTDPRELRVLSSLTYQSLATQSNEREFTERLGRKVWLGELVDAGREPERAGEYLDELAAKARDDYRDGIANRSRREKRRMLAAKEAGIAEILHPNALDLIERIVAMGTGCVILDEAHHLLDYWALILHELIARLPGALVVGLTATPPASAEPTEMANYLGLVNGIDFEVPTPAVVKSGSLAPYQDLVLISEPTATERAFLASEHDLLEQAFAKAFEDPRFLPHLERRINRPALALATPGASVPLPARVGWQTLLSEEFDLAVAGVRFLLAAGSALAEDVEVVPSMRRGPDHRDRMALLREWCLGFLRLSGNREDEATLADLRATLRTLGWSMTETGWRAGSSPIDRVLAYSLSKVQGMVHILTEEAASMGPALRAVVLTDFERTSATALRKLEGILDPDAGGAVQAIRALVAAHETNALDPVMVTGRSVLIDAGLVTRFLQEAEAHLAKRGLVVHLEARDVGGGLALIVGEGGGWGPREYVALVTLNTLVDLTTAGTYASVNQIRGRSIRLDPAAPRKVANNWDVACLATDLSEGASDLHRFAAKHRHVWGLGPKGRIVKGPAHVDERIEFLAGGLTTQKVSPRAINDRALSHARDRDGAYDRWGVGEPYDNFEFRGTVLAAEDVKLKTAFSWMRSLRAMLNTALAMLVVYALLFWQAMPHVLAITSGALRWVVLAALLLAPLALAAPLFWRYFKAAFVDLPVDSYLKDFGRAVAEALRETGLAPADPEAVRVEVTVMGTYDVHLWTKDAATADVFAQAYGELFDPITDQRYLVTREEASLSRSFYRPVWYLIRSVMRIARRNRSFYHPVPEVFGRKRELAEAFGRSWARWVGGGALVYTRSPEGAETLLRERASERLKVRAETLAIWR
jgi:hypothetical protein